MAVTHTTSKSPLLHWIHSMSQWAAQDCADWHVTHAKAKARLAPRCCIGFIRCRSGQHKIVLNGCKPHKVKVKACSPHKGKGLGLGSA